MDYVSRQFIELANRLRKVLADLRDALQKQTKTIGDHYERDNQTQNTQPQIQVFAELHTPEDVERRHSANDDRQYRLQLLLTVGTWLAFIAAAIYAGIATRQLHEMKLATVATQQAATAAATSADTQTRAFHLEERAWVRASPRNAPTFVVGKEIVIPLAILNSGKTPALDFHSDVAVRLLKKKELPEFVYKENSGHPVYKIKGGTIFPTEPSAPTTTVDYVLLEHGKEFIHRNAKPVILTAELSENLKLGDDTWVAVLGQFAYNDVFGIPHWTHFCWVVAFPDTLVKPVQPGKKVCTDYNAIDKNDFQPAAK